MSSAPFLTEVDPRAAVKGSVDPLLLEPLWIGLGRRVVGNLTIAASSVAGYKTTLLGLHVAALVRDRQPRHPALDAFLRVEQVVDYARAAHGDGSFRGVERVNARLHEQRSRATISHRAEHQILSDQRQYGLFGLYVNACRSTGWVVAGATDLTTDGRAFVETHLQPFIGTPMVRLIELATGPDDGIFRLGGRDAALASALAALMAAETPGASAALADALLRGSNDALTEGRQRRLAAHVEAMDLERDYDLAVHREITRRAEAAGDDDLVAALGDIEAVEPLVVAARGAFDFAVSRPEMRVTDVASELLEFWPDCPTIDVTRLRAMAPALDAFAGGRDSAARLLAIADAFASRNFGAAIRKVLDHSRHVMERRGAGPWAVIRPNDTLDVRRADETARPPDAEEMARPWRTSYFLDALWSVARQLRGRLGGPAGASR